MCFSRDSATAEKTATVVVETSPTLNGNNNERNEEKDYTSITTSTTITSSSSGGSADGNDVDTAAAYSVSDADEWMLVSKSSYKQLCDFYERRRKMDSENSDGWWDDAAAAATVAGSERQLPKSRNCEDSAVPAQRVEVSKKWSENIKPLSDLLIILVH